MKTPRRRRLFRKSESTPVHEITETSIPKQSVRKTRNTSGTLSPVPSLPSEVLSSSSDDIISSIKQRQRKRPASESSISSASSSSADPPPSFRYSSRKKTRRSGISSTDSDEYGVKTPLGPSLRTELIHCYLCVERHPPDSYSKKQLDLYYNGEQDVYCLQHHNGNDFNLVDRIIQEHSSKRFYYSDLMEDIEVHPI